MIIYKITNIINGKIYIGQTTVGLQKRWNGHCSNRGGCRLLSIAIKKNGKESFTKIIIEKLSSLEELNTRESYWINYYGSNIRGRGYNLTSGGNNSLHSEDTKKIMSKSATGRKASEETKLKMSQSRKGMARPSARLQAAIMHEKIRGVPLSEGHKKKLSQATKGRKLSPERLVKIKNPMLGKKHTEETKEKIRLSRLGKIGNK